MATYFGLPSSIRSNLLVLQATQAKMDKTMLALSTGNRINSALDNPTAWFAAKDLLHHADGLTSLKDAMAQAIGTIKAADTGISAIESLVEQARGLATAAYGVLGTDAASIATRENLARQFNTIRGQIDTIAGDSGYQGKNLLAGDGRRIHSTIASRADLDAVPGLDNGRVTNATTTDSYKIHVAGTGALSGSSADIAAAEEDRGLTGLKVSGTLDRTRGGFDDITITTRGTAGHQRTVTISDGREARSVATFDTSQSLRADIAAPVSTTDQPTAGQTATITVGGTIEAGDTFRLAVSGHAFTYEARQGDTAAGIAQVLATQVGALSGITATADASRGVVTLTGTPAKGDFTVSATTENAFYKTVSETFASGSVVRFTVDRRRLEAAVNSGNGTSAIEKNVDIRVVAVDQNGTTVERDGRSARGLGKLSAGENAFSFKSGTVRITVNPGTIRQAAENGASAVARTIVTTTPNTANDLTVSFNESHTSTITVESRDVTAQGLGLDAARNGWMDRAGIDRAIADLDAAKATVRAVSQSLSTSLGIINTRETYSREFAEVLVEGANKLLLADQNEEATKLLMLQTRQQLGILALSLAAQSQQAILRLF